MSYLTYEEIKKNIIIDSNDDSPYYDHYSLCKCQYLNDSTCQTNQCINYVTLTECIKCSNKCQNNKFQKNISIQLEVKEVLNKGYGLFCLENVNKKQFIKEYVGELVSEKELIRR